MFTKFFENKKKSKRDGESKRNKIETNRITVVDYNPKDRAGKVIAYTRGVATCTALIIDGSTIPSEELTELGYTGKFCVIYHWDGFGGKDNPINSIYDIFAAISKQFQIIYGRTKKDLLIINSIWLIGGQKSGKEKGIGSDKEINAYNAFFFGKNKKNNIRHWIKEQNITIHDKKLNIEIKPYPTSGDNNLSIYFQLNEEGSPEVSFKKYGTYEKDSSESENSGSDNEDTKKLNFDGML